MTTIGSVRLYDTLTRWDAALKLQPGLALSWKNVNDTTWDFTLRPGVKFHDGGPLTAAFATKLLDEIQSERQAAREARQLAERLGVAATREAIAGVPVSRLLQAQAELKVDLMTHPDPQRWGGEVVLSVLPWQPVVDGDIVPALPIDRVAAGASGEIDLMAGSTTEEWNFFLVPGGAIDQSLIAGWGSDVPGPRQVTVSGIVRFGDADSPGGASFVLFTLDTAQRRMSSARRRSRGGRRRWCHSFRPASAASAAKSPRGVSPAPRPTSPGTPASAPTCRSCPESACACS